MPLPSTGAISMAQVRTELGLSGAISLGQSQVRGLAQVASGAVSLSNLRGKSNHTHSFEAKTEAYTQNASVSPYPYAWWFGAYDDYSGSLVSPAKLGSNTIRTIGIETPVLTNGQSVSNREATRYDYSKYTRYQIRFADDGQLRSGDMVRVFTAAGSVTVPVVYDTRSFDLYLSGSVNMYMDDVLVGTYNSALFNLLKPLISAVNGTHTVNIGMEIV